MSSTAPRLLGTFLFAVFSAAAGLCGTQVNPLFTDHAVLQREAPVEMWVGIR